ncbi:chemotaxis protein CheW [Cellulomonas composti]|uniref:chemotaxis protein CheW n=1 Tax=Cellulomonas composti TaxID=266130 RepID=UPI001FEBBC2B|nr:chemotaxis protein CheW [Cellulomonas composti]
MTSSAAPALPVRVRVRHAVETVRWAPAPRWEGSFADRMRFVAYLGGSMVAWTLAGVGAAAIFGAILR